ncbi:TPA: hypothetical protein N0F65_000424 [Lagenidium giganteum]|uniref:Uncharacterized protein n=1 Tax=Lagenidium giganteum TaxID=4803 RepID=A0AAV2YLK2_9STRA|nr:TPA: hypothetical protein N0F65_000424 [Lagenidium giganteum]
MVVNWEKTTFGTSATNYLGYRITRDGIQPLPAKINAILAIATPTSKTELRRLIGLVNYYRDCWRHRSHLLAKITALTAKAAPFVSTQSSTLTSRRSRQPSQRSHCCATPTIHKSSTSILMFLHCSSVASSASATVHWHFIPANFHQPSNDTQQPSRSS